MFSLYVITETLLMNISLKLLVVVTTANGTRPKDEIVDIVISAHGGVISKFWPRRANVLQSLKTIREYVVEKAASITRFIHYQT